MPHPKNNQEAEPKIPEQKEKEGQEDEPKTLESEN